MRPGFIFVTFLHLRLWTFQHVESSMVDPAVICNIWQFHFCHHNKSRSGNCALILALVNANMVEIECWNEAQNVRFLEGKFYFKMKNLLNYSIHSQLHWLSIAAGFVDLAREVDMDASIQMAMHMNFGLLHRLTLSQQLALISFNQLITLALFCFEV